MKKISILGLLSFNLLFATNYSATSTAIAESKNAACQKALNIDRKDAVEQAGTLVISKFSSNKSDNNGKFNSIKSSDLKEISIGVAKLVSKKENIKVTKDYQFKCKVDAVFSIDENSMKKAIQKYLDSMNKKQNQNVIYLKAVGYSEEGQSRYRAIRAATLDAKRNLLEEIKSSEIYSKTTVKKGRLDSDEIVSNANNSLRFVKILSTKYDSKTKSAVVTVGITKEDFEKNIKK